MVSGVRYRITSKTKIIWKLICMWVKLQKSRKQSIALACEFMHKAFGDGDLMVNVVKSQNENALALIREFTSDVCIVEFNSKSDNIPSNIDVWFYKDTDADIYDWLDSQTSVTVSVSFAIYAFIRTFGVRDITSVIADIVLKDKNIFEWFGIVQSKESDQTDTIDNTVDVESLL